jgi:hypothetical protein
VIELRTRLASNREIGDDGNRGEGGGGLEESRFLGRSRSVPETEGDGVFDHALMLAASGTKVKNATSRRRGANAGLS